MEPGERSPEASAGLGNFADRGDGATTRRIAAANRDKLIDP
jgi:hypothetical protein